MVVYSRGKVRLQRGEEKERRRERQKRDLKLTERYKWLMSKIKRNSLI